MKRRYGRVIKVTNRQGLKRNKLQELGMHATRERWETRTLHLGHVASNNTSFNSKWWLKFQFLHSPRSSTPLEAFFSISNQQVKALYSFFSTKSDLDSCMPLSFSISSINFLSTSYSFPKMVTKFKQ